MLNRLSIRLKLMLLAGVPVLGALALASLLWMHAQRGEKSAAALGSIEDLAELSVGIAGLVQELQAERALSALVLGYAGRATSDDPLEIDNVEEARKLGEARRKELEEQRRATNEAQGRLQRFLTARDLSALPARLRRDIEASTETLAQLPDVRARVDDGELGVTKNVEYFGNANRDLIDATAALTQLSDEGELLRSISALVSVMEVKERASQEHALLASVFALGKFPPGSYRSFVRLTTEEQVYVDVLRSTARDEHVQLYEASQESVEAKRAAAMRRDALENIDEEVDASAAEWFRVQAEGVDALRDLEVELTARVRAAAAMKRADIRDSRRTSLGLSVAALLVSTLLAWLIGRGIASSVGALSGAAAAVQRDNDFSVRAIQTTNDELGQLTVAFNSMLGGIQERDRELDEYRRELETKVEVRTKELRERNAAMRLVLDNVDQGLATIRRDGTLARERSAAFDQWFGAPPSEASFASHLAKDDTATRDLLELAWGEVVEGFLPLDLTIGQLPSQLDVAGRRYTLGYKPILGRDRQFEGALLVVTDVTEEEARRRREAEQAERIAIFERLMQDRAGFVSFFKDAERLIGRLNQPGLTLEEFKRDVHTLKGNCATYAINSVADACHGVEAEVEETGRMDRQVWEPIRTAWVNFASTARPLMGTGDGMLALERSELEELLEAVRARRSHADLETDLERLKFEPVSARFFRIGEQAKRLAKKLGKPDPHIVSEPNEVRLPSGEWAEFWSAFTHVVQNAVDHGLETEEERTAAGKSTTGSLRLAAHATKDGVRIEFHDDGRGVDWEKVRQRARERGLPADTRNDLVAALFSDSVTTRNAATTTSGRGVGLAAVRSATRAMGGRVHVDSSPGSGTTFTFDFPVGSVTRPAPVRQASWSADG